VTVEIRSQDAEEFRAWSDEAVHVYGIAMRRPPEVVAQRRGVMAAHLLRPAFRGAIALDGDALVGFGYAYAGRRGQWWHDVVAGALDAENRREWLGDSVEIVELHVLPGYQGRGIGRRLLRLLLDGATERTAVLSTHDLDSPARHLYRSEGFVDLLTGFVFPAGREVFAVMGKRLADGERRAG
jgi:ribosomal protein S18 acetylase RimI-like enzyme